MGWCCRNDSTRLWDLWEEIEGEDGEEGEMIRPAPAGDLCNGWVRVSVLGASLFLLLLASLFPFPFYPLSISWRYPWMELAWQPTVDVFV